MLSSRYEQELHLSGLHNVAGVDEAGRGCWAGPVVAAAVVFSPQVLVRSDIPALIDDSKALTVSQREAGYALVCTLALGMGLGIVPAYMIDALGIVAATRLAMTVAFLSLPCPVEALLIDAMLLADVALPQRSLVKGDACCFSIAAASIVAKVTRDRLMRHAEQAFPGYGFAAHKGYGTAVHRAALHSRGPCALHRRTFRPVAEVVAGARFGRTFA